MFWFVEKSEEGLNLENLVPIILRIMGSLQRASAFVRDAE